MVDRHHPGKAPTAMLQKLAAGMCLSIADLALELDLTRPQAYNAASKLLRRGYLQRMAVGCYQLTDAGCAAAAAGEVITSGPRGPIGKVREYRDTLRERAWRAMRIRRRFTVPDLISDASSVADKNPRDNLHRYLQGLCGAGIVIELPNRATGTKPSSPGFKRWMLSRDTGPRAPVILTSRQVVHDFNTGEDLPCSRR